MANLNPRQFRMQTNMKAAPGSQGTLFQGGPTPTQPWPRGFSPERRDEVRDALGWHPNRLQGARGIRGNPVFGPGGTRPEQAVGFAVLARSTAPAEHFRNVDIAFGQYARPDSPAGVYRRANPNSENAYKQKNTIAVYQGHAGGTTPLHEVGHHVSNMAGTEHSAYDTPMHRGTEEAYAENYAETHYRDHRGRPLSSFSTDPRGWSSKEGPEGERGGTYRDVSDFEYAFGQEREKSPTAARQRAANDAFIKAPSTGQVPGQTPLLHRVTSGYPSQQHLATWDYTDEHRAQGMRGPSERPWDRGGRTPEQIRNTELARNAERRSRRNR